MNTFLSDQEPLQVCVVPLELSLRLAILALCVFYLLVVFFNLLGCVLQFHVKALLELAFLLVDQFLLVRKLLVHLFDVMQNREVVKVSVALVTDEVLLNVLLRELPLDLHAVGAADLATSVAHLQRPVPCWLRHAEDAKGFTRNQIVIIALIWLKVLGQTLVKVAHEKNLCAIECQVFDNFEGFASRSIRRMLISPHKLLYNPTSRLCGLFRALDQIADLFFHFAFFQSLVRRYGTLGRSVKSHLTLCKRGF